MYLNGYYIGDNGIDWQLYQKKWTWPAITSETMVINSQLMDLTGHYLKDNLGDLTDYYLRDKGPEPQVQWN